MNFSVVFPQVCCIKGFDVTNSQYNKPISPFPWQFIKSRFHCTVYTDDKIILRGKWTVCCRIVKYLWPGSRDGAMVRVVTCLPPLWLGFDSWTRCGLRLLLVLILAPRVFLWVLWCSSHYKNQRSKFQLDLETVYKKSHLVEYPLLNYLLFIYYYYYIIITVI